MHPVIEHQAKANLATNQQTHSNRVVAAAAAAAKHIEIEFDKFHESLCNVHHSSKWILGKFK